MNKENIQAMLKEALERADLLMRPKILYLHPKVKGKLLKQFPDMEKQFVIMESELMEMDKVYVIDRKELEQWLTPNVGRYFDEDVQNDTK